MESDSVIKSLLEKGLQDVTLVFDDTRILGNIDHTRFSAINAFYEGKEHKYYVGAIGEDREYTVILREYNEYSYYQFLRTIGYFLLFTLPFSLGFYIIGYYFVGKNFKPIREMIESLEDFSANINHELKTPITEIISTLSLSQELGKNHEKAIETSLHSANKLAKILDSMLGIVNLVDSSFQREKVDLIAEIDKIIRDNDRAIQEKGLILRKTFHEKSWTIPINREHLHICVGNILKNAIKYSYDGGTIEIIFKN